MFRLQNIFFYFSQVKWFSSFLFDRNRLCSSFNHVKHLEKGPEFYATLDLDDLVEHTTFSDGLVGLKSTQLFATDAIKKFFSRSDAQPIICPHCSTNGILYRDVKEAKRFIFINGTTFMFNHIDFPHSIIIQKKVMRKTCNPKTNCVYLFSFYKEITYVFVFLRRGICSLLAFIHYRLAKENIVFNTLEQQRVQQKTDCTNSTHTMENMPSFQHPSQELLKRDQTQYMLFTVFVLSFVLLNCFIIKIM